MDEAGLKIRKPGVGKHRLLQGFFDFFQKVSETNISRHLLFYLISLILRKFGILQR